ncbi:ChaN family lipoprotein [Aeromonas sp. R6-2]|uniref:ChaN family lipoprotein n=1 Tax=unclassified Aeromonas TaxID=257493 RepID=UPI0034A42268
MRLLSLVLTALLAGCATPPSPLPTLYDYRLQAGDTPLSLTAATERLQGADIILVGELHSHPAVHLFQARLLAQLSLSPRALTLSMEQFSRADQAVVDAYLAGRIGESALMRAGHAWPNYQSDYRPLVEFAKARQMPVIAANAPKGLVSCIGEQGPAWLNTLPANHRRLVAAHLTLGEDGYRQRFMASLHHGDNDSNARRFAAQTAWDDTMAESMVTYLAAHPGRRIMHIAGNFHVEGGWGLASRIAARNPALKVALVIPVSEPQSGANGRQADLELHIAPLPERWKNREEMKREMASLHRARERDCSRWQQP